MFILAFRDMIRTKKIKKHPWLQTLVLCNPLNPSEEKNYIKVLQRYSFYTNQFNLKEERDFAYLKFKIKLN